MATTVSSDVRAARAAAFPAAQEISAIPWYIWVLFAAVVSVVVGGYWDISWHMSIGRDTFWTPAHIAIQMCGILAGFSCAYLIFSCTFSRDPALRSATVEVWKFRGPLGAFIAAWGGATMLSSAPFDNWWHNAYGLDVKIFSPPHVVLDGGVLAIQVGAVVLIASTMNRAAAALVPRLDRLLLLLGGMVTMLALTVVWESTYRVLMHSAQCYRAIAIVLPVVLIGFAMISRQRWACTIVAAIYTGYAAFMLWLFPFFPATPKLGPVYQHITHMVPMEFPLLVIVPAFLLDVLRPRIARLGKWTQAVALGIVFLAALLAVQWPFADFLISPASANRFFGTKYLAYFASPDGFDVRHLFFPVERTASQFWRVMTEAFVLSILSARLGLAWGGWVRRIRR
jgi:hypothetical protein